MKSLLIPGIYNYCDRWCERCGMASRCQLGLREFNNMISADYKEVTLEDALERVRESFELLGEMLQEAEEKFDIDLNNLPEVEEVEIDDRGQEVLIWTHDFMTKSYELLSNRNPVMQQIAHFPGDDLGAFLNLSRSPIREHFEVLDFYNTMVGSKCHRAVHGLFNDRGEEEDEIQTDYNGSAKVALLCCKECRNALKGIYDMVEDEDAILDLLQLIQKIIDRMEEMFPNAYKFVRPGFDD